MHARLSVAWTSVPRVNDSAPAVRLQEWTQADLSLLRAANAPAMMAHLGGPETEDQLLDRHQRYLQSEEPGAGRMYALVLPDGGRAGIIGYWERTWQDALVYETGWGVLPAGGAHGIARYLRRFGPEGTGARLAGLCDAGEARIVARGLAAADLGAPGSHADLKRLGFLVCVEDLEDELIRAAGPELVTEVFAAHGDLGAFRIIQRQPAWRGKDEAAQLRRSSARARGASSATLVC
jgi:hypothetical protein